MKVEEMKRINLILHRDEIIKMAQRIKATSCLNPGATEPVDEVMKIADTVCTYYDTIISPDQFLIFVTNINED